MAFEKGGYKMLHYPVLLKESVDLLNIKPDGLYIDGTFGRGGHTKEILSRLSTNGRLIAFDKDIEAINYGQENINDSRLTLIHDSFANIHKYIVDKVDGVLLDLGVSSPQLDTKERGFSHRFEATLDMRMDNTKGQSAHEWINTVDEATLADVLWRYGEEKFSRKIAKNIINARNEEALTTTSLLSKVISNGMPFIEKGQHPATRSFQAIRIFINNELGDLEQILDTIPKYLNPLGRVVVISFHSLEDRIVKTKFNELSVEEKLPKWINKQVDAPEFRVIAKKIKASLYETEQNNRSRSAVLRCLEKI
jgi:16S rRNA (cytosine1402-N4)-methyltransferase